MKYFSTKKVFDKCTCKVAHIFSEMLPACMGVHNVHTVITCQECFMPASINEIEKSNR